MVSRQPEPSGAARGDPQTTGDVVLRIEPASDGDDAELATLTQRLRIRLLDLDVDSVDPIPDPAQPEGAKGLETLIGWLAVRLGKEVLGKVIGGVVDWALRTNHTIEIIYHGESLKVSGVTSAQQERLIDEFLARHAPGP
jgi:hypothetical protein